MEKCLFACVRAARNPCGLTKGRFWHSEALWSFWNKQVLLIERVAQEII